MENKQANKQKTSDGNGHGRRTTTTEIWKRKAEAGDWNEGKGTGTTTQAWPRTGENKIEQQKVRVQSEKTMQLERTTNRKLRTETEKKLENETIRTGMVKLKSAICLPKLEWKKFDGDTLKLHMFCDMLSTIPNNQTLQKVDRFKCLESKVWGKATHSLKSVTVNWSRWGFEAYSLRKELHIYVNKKEETACQVRQFQNLTEKIFWTPRFPKSPICHAPQGRHWY